MDFLADFGSSFLVYFVIFMVVAVIAIIIRTIRNKNKEKGYRGYLAQHFPSLASDIPVLMAKSESKKVKPDMALVIVIDQQQVIVMRNLSGKEVTHKLYSGADLTQVNLTDQMISRGFAPKTWSFEQCLELVFNDGKAYKYYLENISNRNGTDAGADTVREIFKPWYRSLSKYLK